MSVARNLKKKIKQVKEISNEKNVTTLFFFYCICGPILGPDLNLKEYIVPRITKIEKKKFK